MQLFVERFQMYIYLFFLFCTRKVHTQVNIINGLQDCFEYQY